MSYITYLRWGAISALFLALFVPFVVASGTWGAPNLFFPYITGKNFAFRILVELAVLCYVLLALREPKYRPRSSLIMYSALAFVVWMAVATVFSVDPVKSFWSNFERMEGYIGLLHFFAWFVVTGAVLTAERLWDRFINTSITVAAAQSLWAFMQFLGYATISTQSGARADTTFGNAIYLAVFLLINVFLTLYMLARLEKGPHSNKTTLQALYGVALVLQVAGIFFTETRGAILGLAVGLVVGAFYLLFFARGKESRTLRRIALGAVGVVLVIAGGIYVARDTAFVKESPVLRRVASLSLTETTVVSRLKYIWPMAISGGLEKPLTGWGQENFNFVFNAKYDPGMYNQEQWFDRAHNQFLDWLIAGGIPAFLLYTSLYVLALLAVWRSRDKLSLGEQAALVGLLAGYAFNNSFVFDNLVSGIYFFALLAYLHSLTRRELPRFVWYSRPLGEHALAIVAPVVIGIGLLGAWSFNGPGLVRASTLVTALQNQEAGTNSAGLVVGVPKDPKKQLAQFNDTINAPLWPGTALGRQEAVEQLLQFATNIAPQGSLNPAVRQDIYGVTHAAITTLLHDRPGDARLELFAATFYGPYGQAALSLEHMRAALALSPRKQQILIQEGLTLLQAGSAAEALVPLKQSFDSAPGYDAARYYYAAGLYYAKQSAAADALLMERYGTTVVDNPQLLQVFMALKIYDRAIAIWLERVAAAPKDADVRLGLASVYFAAGDRARTVAVLREVVKLSPKDAAQIEQLIKQIEDGTLKP
ncbi:tetratricopeptide repeat protein [Candidatus Kaiserbacteria bacterium]|nr:tetratricopeptide repeat protein [Candidatus Kaiserbacteria bacterium]